MKIYNKKDFLNLPPGTFFSKGVQWSMNGLYVKGETWGNDFIFVDLIMIDAESSDILFDRYEEMLKNGKSYAINQDAMRDGSFDDEEVFLVFEKEDLKRIKELIEITINL